MSGPRLLAGRAPERADALFFVETAALWGGPQKRLFRLASAWARRGNATAVAAVRGDEHSEPGELERFGVPVLALTEGGKEVLKSFRCEAALAARALVARLRPRVAFTMETLVDYHVRIGLFGRALPVVTLLGIDRWRWEEKLHRRLMMRFLARGPGAVVANSERGLAAWRRVIGERRVARRPSAVLPNPVAPSELEARFERDTPGRLVVGGLGRFQPQKGFDVLLEAFAALPVQIGGRATHLRLQGHGPAEAELRARATREDVAGRVELVPFTPRVEPFLHSLDVLVVPSRWSGFENVALEGALSGTPVLCSSGAGLDALAHDPAFAPFEPTASALLPRLAALLERTGAERARLARAQRERVVAELDSAVIAERLARFLAESGVLRG